MRTPTISRSKQRGMSKEISSVSRLLAGGFVRASTLAVVLCDIAQYCEVTAKYIIEDSVQLLRTPVMAIA
jgi:hypothetical protein